MTLSENIKSRRKHLRLSQEYVADQLGISRQAVAKWENGKSNPTAANLAELAALFEMSISIFFLPRLLLAQMHKMKNFLADMVTYILIIILAAKYWRYIWEMK